jgi:hypothetical protein
MEKLVWTPMLVGGRVIDNDYNNIRQAIDDLIDRKNLTSLSNTGTSTLIYTNATGLATATLKMHSHLNTSGVANEFKGEFINTSGTMDGIASHWSMNASGTGVMRAVIGVSYLPAGVTLSGTSAAANWVSGGLFAADVAGTAVLNGTAVIFNALCGKVSSAINSTMTAVKHTSALYGISALLTKPVSGECSILHLAQEAGATCVNQAIYIEGGATVDAFVTIDVAAAGKAIETSVVNIGGGTANTAHALHIRIGTGHGYIPVYNNSNFTA